MFCTTIIPTVGRPELSRAVTSVLEQNFRDDAFEIIVVNDSGNPLPRSDWQLSDKVKIIHTQRRERSVARNTGAAVAQGRYLHFLDDDDWLMPDAFRHLWGLAQTTSAPWLYGGTQLISRKGEPLIELHQELGGNSFLQVMAGEHIHLQASLIEADAFFAVGGFNPLLVGPEDIDLLRRIALIVNFAYTPATVVCKVMGEEGSTTDFSRHSEWSRWAREKILNEPGVLSRMRMSADSAYWYGRLVRIYLTSLLWNLQHRRIFTALSRGLFSLASMMMAGRYLLLPEFWRAIPGAYASRAFDRGFQKVAETSAA